LGFHVLAWTVPLEATPQPLPAKARTPKCSLWSLTCLQVKVLPRQWMVGPSSHSRLGLGETPVGASSAVNGRACRWHKSIGGDGSAALTNMQAATSREDCRPESKPSWEAREEELLEPPNRVWSGEGSYDRGMNHQVNSVSQRDRGRSMHEQYGKEKKGR
jgi:hypothetical protein